MEFWALEHADDSTILFFGALLFLAVATVMIFGFIQIIKERKEKKRENCKHENMYEDLNVKIDGVVFKCPDCDKYFIDIETETEGFR